MTQQNTRGDQRSWSLRHIVTLVLAVLVGSVALALSRAQSFATGLPVLGG